MRKSFDPGFAVQRALRALTALTALLVVACGAPDSGGLPSEETTVATTTEAVHEGLVVRVRFTLFWYDLDFGDLGDGDMWGRVDFNNQGFSQLNFQQGDLNSDNGGPGVGLDAHLSLARTVEPGVTSLPIQIGLVEDDGQTSDDDVHDLDPDHADPNLDITIDLLTGAFTGDIDSPCIGCPTYTSGLPGDGSSGVVFIVTVEPICHDPTPCALPANHPTCPGAPGTIDCAGDCRPNNADATELPNGIDDNCDGVGLEDEFCDGVDNDMDGKIDEDVGSCRFRMLITPLCWTGDDASFSAAASLQANTFLQASGFSACSNNVWFQTVPPSVLNVPCPFAPDAPSLFSIQAAVTAGLPAGVNLFDFDGVAALTDANLALNGDLSVRGATDAKGSFWSESTVIGASRPDVILSHEFGHVLGLDDEYCSSVPEAGGPGVCSGALSINALSGTFGCDPTTTSCCSVAFRDPNQPAGTFPDDLTPCAGQYEICCLGNSAVTDPNASTLTNDPAGRCPMSSTFGMEPRRFCQACIGHLRAEHATCEYQHNGTARILVTNMVTSPPPVRITSLSYVDGRGGLQNVAPRTTGDIVLELVRLDTGVLLATRGLDLPTAGSAEEAAISAEAALRFPLPDDLSSTEKIRVTTLMEGNPVGQTTINGSPPVAFAGPDQLIECSAQTTPVVLDASGSSDADGDSLRFSWSTGDTTAEVELLLPLGPYDFEVEVTDGIETTTDAVHVLVRDTSGPLFTLIPPDITTSSCTNVNLGAAVAEDPCGGDVTITNNRPAKFNLGTNVVTWTATDARGNPRTALQKVTVLLGDDPACCPAGTNVILGTSSNNTLNGTIGADCILGLGAQDTINGNGGNDFISGGHGNDVLNGNAGNDSVFGGPGQDSVNGNAGADLLAGGDGDDGVFGGTENDTLRGGQGQDQLDGQDGDDLLNGDEGHDTLSGGNGNDTLSGASGNDNCTGGAGTNVFEQCEFGAVNACSDSIVNGTQTDVDCGGGCPGCGEGETCTAGDDCLSNVCSGGVCQTLPGGIAVDLVIEADWGGGYCARLEVSNVLDLATTNWETTINLNGSTIYTSSDATFSSNTGTTEVTPTSGGDPVVEPGITVKDVDFCANRTVSTSGALPFVVDATGSY